MMSTTGAPSVGQPDPETLKALFGGPPAHPADPAVVAATAALAFDRAHDELGGAGGRLTTHNR